MTAAHDSCSFFVEKPGGRLEAILWKPSSIKRPPLAAVVGHPHPLFGGTMHNKVVYQTAKTLDALGIPVLRFNFRGAGLSSGVHDNGRGEQDDVRAALDFLAGEFPGVPLLLAGFSFGAWVGLRVGCADPRVSELIGLGLPVGNLSHREISYLEACAKPKLLVSGELDGYSPPGQLEAVAGRFRAHVKEQTQVAVVPAADHFFAGHLSELDRVMSGWLAARHPELTAR